MDKKVTVYSTPTCPYCIRAKQFLKENGVSFDDVDISLSPERVDEMVQKSGQMSVPVLDIEGEIVVGFDIGKIKAALKL
ncbi:MAG: glutaredoxin family protein [Candidatus Omnitrophica bacterium]|nr:glutaredoxin family protein [Candidatus Omnitrophota bacterium]